MAKIVIKNDILTKKYSNYRWLTILGFGACGLSFVLFAVCTMTFNFGYCFPLMVTFLGGGILGYIMYGKSEILKSGVDGEDSLEKIISRLPDSFVGYRNMKVNFNGQSSELDMVIAGPTGVFIIEAKNMRGYISGSYENPQWVQGKIGRGGTPYSSQFYSPVKQVGTHTYRLANVLRNAGARVHINPVVYFSNFDASVQVSGTGETPVFSASNMGANELLQYIANREVVVSPTDLGNIVAILNRI